MRSLIMSSGAACQNLSCRSWSSSRRSLSFAAWINFFGNSFKSSAGRTRDIVLPRTCILSSVMSLVGCSALLSETSVSRETARGPGGSGTMACDGICGRYSFDRTRRLISFWMSLPSVVILQNMDMLTDMSLMVRCVCSSVCE